MNFISSAMALIQISVPNPTSKLRQAQRTDPTQQNPTFSKCYTQCSCKAEKPRQVVNVIPSKITILNTAVVNSIEFIGSLQ